MSAIDKAIDYMMVDSLGKSREVTAKAARVELAQLRTALAQSQRHADRWRSSARRFYYQEKQDEEMSKINLVKLALDLRRAAADPMQKQVILGRSPQVFVDMLDACDTIIGDLLTAIRFAVRADEIDPLWVKLVEALEIYDSPDAVGPADPPQEEGTGSWYKFGLEQMAQPRRAQR